MPLKKKFKAAAIVFSVIIILTAAILLVLYNIFRISYNENDKSENVSSITISRDRNGIPLITAESTDDLYFALGYLHAKDRPNVLEYLRALATGDSGNFAGDDTMFLNNLSKTIGFTKSAEEITARLKESEISALKSYVRGINHIQNKNRVRNITNREWRVEDIIAILTMKEWANSYLNNKELIFNMPLTKLQTSKKLFNENRYLFFYNEDDLSYIYTLRRIKEITEKYFCTFARGNSIYISPELSSSGTDQYTTLNYEDSISSYPGWYPVRFEVNGKKTFAVTYSGLPFILSFKNDAISLTQININADTQNFYLFDTEYQESVPHYKAAGSLKEYKSIRIPSFNNNEITSEIKWVTEKGPVFSDLINSVKSDSRILVIDSIHPGPEYISFLLKLPFENNIEKIRQTVITNDSSLKCFMISDNKKAYKIYSGLINQPDNSNLIFINGSSSVKSPAAKISVIKQITGIDYSGSDLTSAKEVSNNYKNIISNEFKIQRFNSLILKKKIYDNSLIKDIITDNISVAAEKFIPVFDSAFENNPLTSSKLTRIYFNDWNFSADSRLQSPALFYTILSVYIREFYKEEFGSDTDFNLNNSHLLYPDFLEICQKKITGITGQLDITNIKNREKIYDVSFLDAMRFLNRKEGPLMENWKWGQINKTAFKIPNIKLNFFSRFFSVEDRPLSGGPDTIENLIQNNKFYTVSATSFQSFMNKDEFWFKMNTGYSTAMLSDFYYGRNIIDDFQNMGTSNQSYTSTITSK